MAKKLRVERACEVRTSKRDGLLKDRVLLQDDAGPDERSPWQVVWEPVGRLSVFRKWNIGLRGAWGCGRGASAPTRARAATARAGAGFESQSERRRRNRIGLGRGGGDDVDEDANRQHPDLA